MKLFILALFSLILSVSTEDEIVIDTTLDQVPANSLYETLFSEYYNTQQSHYPQKLTSNKKSSKNKSSSKNQGSSNQGQHGPESGKKQSNYKHFKSEFEHYNNYLKAYEGHKGDYYNKLIGRQGLGFDKRSATSYGFRAPLTPEQLELVGEKKEYKEKEVHPIIVV